MNNAVVVAEHRYRILLLTSLDVRMVALRAMLDKEPLVRSVTEVTADRVVAAVTRSHPDALALCRDADPAVIVGVAASLHAAAPTLTILAFTDAVDYPFEIALGRLQVASYLLWDDLNPVSLHWLLGGTLEAGLRVVSPAAVDEVVLPPERRRQARDAKLRLSDQERIVLRGLVRGFSDRQLAAAIDRSERTVHRLLIGLQVKLGVGSRAELIVRAVELGFGVE